MRVEVNDNGSLHVTLSRRNLLSLLAKLDGHPPDSACTIVSPSFYDVKVLVSGEEDEVHYASAERLGLAAGPMHPDTEAKLS